MMSKARYVRRVQTPSKLPLLQRLYDVLFGQDTILPPLSDTFLGVFFITLVSFFTIYKYATRASS
tara:strand:- start:296 stop:490 length:195 start_codon:yes stop_codon:yes gene_type:complete